VAFCGAANESEWTVRPTGTLGLRRSRPAAQVARVSAASRSFPTCGHSAIRSQRSCYRHNRIPSTAAAAPCAKAVTARRVASAPAASKRRFCRRRRPDWSPSPNHLERETLALQGSGPHEPVRKALAARQQKTGEELGRFTPHTGTAGRSCRGRGKPSDGTSNSPAPFLHCGWCHLILQTTHPLHVRDSTAANPGGPYAPRRGVHGSSGPCAREDR
jgi:hypothetical protein